MSMDEKLDSLQRTDRVVHPTSETTTHAYIKDYDTEYRKSIADPEAFWGGVAIVFVSTFAVGARSDRTD